MSDAARLRDFVSLFGAERRSPFDGDRSRLIHSQAPLSDVDVVCSEVRHLPAGVIPEEAEVVMNSLDVIGTLRSGTEPHVIIKFCGRIAVRNRRPAEVGTGQPNHDSFQLAEPSIANQLARQTEAIIGTLLRTGLHDAAMCASRFDHLASFDDRQAQRLFAVHIFARLAGMNRR